MDTETERPRFRNDLVAQPIEEEGVRYVDVTDPSSGSTFRFYDVEYSIACAMDGARDVDNLAEWTRAELGIEASPEELVSVINTLAELGYLEGTTASAPAVGYETAAPGTEMPTLEVEPVEPAAEARAAHDDGVPESMEAAVATEAQPSSYTDELPEVEVAPPAGEAAADETPPAHEIEAEEPPPVQAAEETLPEDSAETAESAELDESAGLEPQPSGEQPEQEPGTPVAMDEAEVSFAGILDEEEAAREATPRPIVRPKPEPAQHLDDEDPTQIPPSLAHEEEDEDDVSVDLSAHLALDKKEVADAVRSSRVHAIPELPREMTLEITDDDKVAEDQTPPPAAEPAPIAASSSARPVPPPPPAFGGGERREEGRPSTRPLADEPRVAPAVALPSRPPAPMSAATTTGSTSRPRVSRPIEPTRMPPPATAKAPPGRSASVGWLLLALIVGAGILFYVFQDQILGSGEHSSASRPRAPAAAPATPRPTGDPPTAMRPPDPPAFPAAVVRAAEAEASAAEARSPSAGTISWIVGDGTTVEKDAPVAKLFGFAKHEEQIRQATARGEVYIKRRDDARTKGDLAAEEAAQRKVDEKRALVDQAQQELEKYLVKAPAAGKVKLLVAKGAKIEPDAPVASIEGDSANAFEATFDAGTGASSYKPEAACIVASRSAQDRQFPCVVSAVEGGIVTVRLVGVSGAAIPAAGDEIVLLPPK